MFFGSKNMQPLNFDEIAVAWRALSTATGLEGWRSIKVSGHSKIELRAGRQFPGNEEALLILFDSVGFPFGCSFPEGNGFKVERAFLEDSEKWVALVRQGPGNLDLFTQMVADIVSLLSSIVASEQQIFQIFLAR